MTAQEPRSTSEFGWSSTTGFLLCATLVLSGTAAFSQSGQTNPSSASTSEPASGSSTDSGALQNTVSDSRTIKQLTAALRSQERTVRASAVFALGQRKDPHAVKALIDALQDEDPYVRAIADTELIGLGPVAVEPLVIALKENDPYVPALSALALSKIKDPRSHEALMNALQEHNSRAIFGIHTYFVKLGVPGSEPALIEALGKFPSREMAEEFLNSGNPALEKAAQEWATRFNRTLRTSPTSAAVRWGSAGDNPQQTATSSVAGAQ